MLQHTGTGHGAFLGHMAHNKEGDAHLLGEAKENRGRLSDLRDASGRGRHLVTVHGLDGIDDDGLRLFPHQKIGDGFQVGLAQKTKRIRCASDSGGAELDLPQGLLTRYIQDGYARLRHIAGRLQQDGRLANAGIAAYQDQRACYCAAAQDTVQL